MKKSTYFWLVLTMGFMACSASNVIVEKDIYDDFDLNKYKSYSFMEVDVSGVNDDNFELAVGYLKEEISTQLTARGLSEDNSNPGLKINLGVVVEDKEQTRETSLATDPFMYTGQRNYKWESQEIVVNNYREGTLSVHLVDAETNQAAWVGVVSKVVPTKQEKKQAAIKGAVSEIFEALDN